MCWRKVKNFLPTIILGMFFVAISTTFAAPKDEFVTALTGKFPPFNYYNEQGELAGFDVDVSREIAKRLKKNSRIVVTDWDGIIAGLLTSKYDAVIGSMAVTPEREKNVSFSVPYYKSGAQLFTHRDNPEQVYSIDECSGLRIAVVLGESYQEFLEKNYPEIEVVTFKSSVEIFEMLEQKRISGFVTDRLVGSWQIKKADRAFVPIGGMLYSENIAIPVRKDSSALLKQINRAVNGMKADGTLKGIYQKYFGLNSNTAVSGGEGMTFATIANKLLRGFGVTLLVAFLAIALGFLMAVPTGILLVNDKGLWFIPSKITRMFVDFIRGTPVLIQLLFVWLGLGFKAFPAAVSTLGVCAMCYMAEAVRSGLISVPPGQALAARALGLSAMDRFRFVIWPQAFRIALPSLMNSVVALIKDTALISVISIPELIREAQSIISVTFDPQKYYLIAALMFFAVTFPLMKISGQIEKAIQAKGFKDD